MSIILSIGRWGGVYVFYRDYSIRLCLGWLALTILPEDIDVALDRLRAQRKEGQ